MSDEGIKLIVRISAGEEKALTKFYELYYRSVYGYALKQLREPADAADIVSQVMVEAWRSADKFEGRSKVRTWILGIARYKILDQLRQRHRHSKVDSLDADDEIHIEDEDADSLFDQVLKSEHSIFVRQCLEGLTAAQKEVVYLAFFEGLVYHEISVVIDIPEGTVKSRIHQAKSALRKCLRKLVGLNIEM